MMYSIPDSCRPYGSDIFLCSATRKRYILEQYPSRKRGAAEYNPLYDAFQPITPPPALSNYPQQNRPRSIYEKSNAYYYDNDQRQRNTGKQSMVDVLIKIYRMVICPSFFYDFRRYIHRHPRLLFL